VPKTMAGRPVEEIALPPGLGGEPDPEAARPKPRIAYQVSKDDAAAPPSSSGSSSPAQALPLPDPAPLRVPGPAVSLGRAVSDEGQPTARFCVFCGMRVAPRLVAAKFCVYCGNVHSGQVDCGHDQDILPPPLSECTGGSFLGALMYGPNVDKALVNQALAAYTSSPAGYMEDSGYPYQLQYDVYEPWQGWGADWSR